MRILHRSILAGVLVIPSLIAVTGPSPRAIGAAVGPSARSAMSMAPDANGDLVMFGGDIGAGVEFFDDTWTWDGTSWTERHPANHPSKRCCYGLAYDAIHRQTVLFGGSNGYDFFDDTWTWDGTNWIEQHPTHDPLARSNLMMAYDPTPELVVLYGGCCPLNDTWLWNGRNWKKWLYTTDPPGRELAGFAYDPPSGEIAMFGGDGSCDDRGCRYWDSTWTWHAGEWSRRWPDTHPGITWEMGMAFDPISQVVVMFGGCCAKDATWQWDEPTWTKLHAASSPPAISRMAMATDTTRGEIVLFGGRDANEVDFAGTWTWDGSTWVCVLSCA